MDAASGQRIPSRRRAADASRRAALLLLTIAPRLCLAYISLGRLARGAPGPHGSVRGFIQKLSGLRRRHDARPAPLLAEPLVEHGAVAEGEEREVAPHADVRPRMHVRAALADEDVAGPHALAGEDLDPAPLPRAVASVAGAALTLLVRH